VPEHLLQRPAVREVDVLVDIEEEGPIGHVPVQVEAVVHHQKLIVVVAVVVGLRPDVLEGDPASPQPGIQHRPDLRADAAGVVEHEVRAGPEEARVVGEPLPHPGGAEVAVERGTAVEVLIGEGLPEARVVVGPRRLLERDEALVLAGGGGVVGVDEEAAAGVPRVGVGGEGAVDDDDGVDAAVPPVGQHLVRLGPDGPRRGGGGGGVRQPLALEVGGAEDVGRLGCEPDDGECARAAPVRAHLDEQRRRRAVRPELPLVGVPRHGNCLCGRDGGVGGWEDGGGVGGCGGGRAGEERAGSGGRAGGGEERLVRVRLPERQDQREEHEQGDEALDVDAGDASPGDGGRVLPRGGLHRRADPVPGASIQCRSSRSGAGRVRVDTKLACQASFTAGDGRSVPTSPRFLSACSSGVEVDLKLACRASFAAGDGRTGKVVDGTH
jgi:hypothetical protein